MLTGRPTPCTGVRFMHTMGRPLTLTRHCKNISLWPRSLTLTYRLVEDISLWPRSLTLTYRHVEDISLWPRSLTMARHVEDISFGAACNLH